MTGTKKFQRRLENFTCENCGHSISGNGYTNHCPKCLYSKHVDINPGDRAAQCHALMEPIDLLIQKGQYIITHQCTACLHQRKNKSSPTDHIESLISLSQKF